LPRLRMRGTISPLSLGTVLNYWSKMTTLPFRSIWARVRVVPLLYSIHAFPRSDNSTMKNVATDSPKR
jgi:hypothetical protein